MFLTLPLIICILGLIIYVLPLPGKVCEIGRIMFWVGLLTFLWGNR